MEAGMIPVKKVGKKFGEFLLISSSKQGCRWIKDSKLPQACDPEKGLTRLSKWKRPCLPQKAKTLQANMPVTWMRRTPLVTFG